MLCQTSILLPSSTLVSSRGRELKKTLRLPSPWHPAWRKRSIRNEDRTVTAGVWNKLVQTLTCMEMLLVWVWTCGCVTEPHFIPMPEVLLEFDLWPYFPGYSRVKLQSKKTPSAPHFVQFIYPFFRTEVGLSFDMISAMRVWVSGGGGISWLTAGLSFLCSSIIAMNTVQLPFSFSNETVRIPKVQVFPQVLHSYAYMHTATSHIVFPPCYTSLSSDNLSMLSK